MVIDNEDNYLFANFLLIKGLAEIKLMDGWEHEMMWIVKKRVQIERRGWFPTHISKENIFLKKRPHAVA